MRALVAAVVGHLVSCLFAGFLVAVHFYVLLGLAACADRLARAAQRVPVEGASSLAQAPSPAEVPPGWTHGTGTASGKISSQHR